MSDKKSPLSVLKKIGRAAWYGLSALIVPLNINKDWSVTMPFGKLAIFVGTYFFAQPLSTYLLPTAEDVLKKEGLPVTLVDDMTGGGKHIRVVPGNFWGKLYTAFSNVPILSPAKFYQNVTYINNPDLAAYTEVTPTNIFFVDKVYFVHMKEKEWYAEALAVKSGDGGKQLLSTDEYYQQTLMHEFRHVSPKNQKIVDGPWKEGDCDYNAAAALSKAKNDPDLAERTLLQSAYSKDYALSHATVLYVDAMMNLTQVPTVDQIDWVRGETTEIFNKMLEKESAMRMGTCEKYVEKYANDTTYNQTGAYLTIKGMCEYRPDASNLSPLAQRRVALYMKAHDRIYPVVKKPGS